MNLRDELERRLSRALADAGAPAGSPALVAPAGRPEFGDYQANGVMAAAKQLKVNPREFAEKVKAAAKLDDIVEKVEVAGPGFLNVRLKDEFITGRLAEVCADEQLGVEPSEKQTVVVDYSGPNLAKEMHVGHLRSTIIGDALTRVLEFLGQNVIRQNHVGDWGTQFGMLIAYLERLAIREEEPSVLADLEEFYRAAKHLFDTDADFADRSRACVVELQSGEQGSRSQWEYFLDQSLQHCEFVYKSLGVRLTRDDVRGESAYNDDLPSVVEDLKKAKLLTESQGAQCVFLDEFKDKDGNVLPVIVRKSDGGYLYATTDLAAIRHRVGELKADRVLYVTDSRQALHFRQVFAVAQAAGFAPESVSLEHVAFGMMLGAGRTPFKTREGGTVKLTDLLDEAEKRAEDLVRLKNPELAADESRLKKVAHAVGIGAVKYADLCQNRASDYVFSWDKMLSLDGNTAPYMQYAYARIRSIFRKEESTPAYLPEAGRNSKETSRDRKGAGIIITHPAERLLAVKLLQFPETVRTVADECLPNVLCGYLYDLAGAFMGFYENCPVLKADAATRAGRLALCELTARTISKGLGLLGIETPEQM
ncbi:MAG: arginine--tRNA ligase [Planctomycetota bacterium]|nr:arginine--tRNA ligase [Planctomycetota bacterium]